VLMYWGGTSLTRRTTNLGIVLLYWDRFIPTFLRVQRKSSSSRLCLYPNEWNSALKGIFGGAPKVRGERYVVESSEYGRPKFRERGKGILISRVK